MRTRITSRNLASLSVTWHPFEFFEETLIYACISAGRSVFYITSPALSTVLISVIHPWSLRQSTRTWKGRSTPPWGASTSAVPWLTRPAVQLRPSAGRKILAADRSCPARRCRTGARVLCSPLARRALRLGRQKDARPSPRASGTVLIEQNVLGLGGGDAVRRKDGEHALTAQPRERRQSQGRAVATVPDHHAPAASLAVPPTSCRSVRLCSPSDPSVHLWLHVPKT